MENNTPAAEQQNEEVKVYPTAPDTDGFFFQDAEEEALGISTKTYEDNGKTVKKVLLSNNRVAIVRELNGAEGIHAKKQTGKDGTKLQEAFAAFATRVDDKPINIDELLAMKAKDCNRITIASSLLNF